MDDVKQRINRPRPPRSTSAPRSSSTTPNQRVFIPYIPSLAPKIKQTLRKYSIDVTYTSSPNLRSLLSKTKSPLPAQLTQNAIYRIPCQDCPASYIGQTLRPVLTRIKEHERCYRLKNAVDLTTGNIKSGAALHALHTDHEMNWSATEILSTATSSSHLDMLEQAAIQILQPSLNRTAKAPSVSQQWDPILPIVASSFNPRSAKIPILQSTSDPTPPTTNPSQVSQ